MKPAPVGSPLAKNVVLSVFSLLSLFETACVFPTTEKDTALKILSLHSFRHLGAPSCQNTDTSMSISRLFTLSTSTHHRGLGNNVEYPQWIKILLITLASASGSQWNANHPHSHSLLRLDWIVLCIFSVFAQVQLDHHINMDYADELTRDLDVDSANLKFYEKVIRAVRIDSNSHRLMAHVL
jgi:hypothetical protein